MRRFQVITQVCMVLGLLSAICFAGSQSGGGEEPPVLDVEQRFVASGWIGDGQASTECIQQVEAWRENPHSGPTCVKVIYTKFGSEFGWGGVYWQYPPDNWGQKPGLDLSKAGYKSITLWAKGERGGECVEFLAGGIERDQRKYPECKYKDSFFATAGKVFLSGEWQKHYIDLEGKDLSNVIGGFCWVASQTSNPNGPTFYIDDIFFTHEQAPKVDYLDIGKFFTASGWMGDGKSGRKCIRLEEACRTNRYSPPACIKVIYTDYGSDRWGGIYWQNRQDNWGEKPGWDLSKAGYRSVTFWARGERGNEIVEFKAGGIDATGMRYKDSFEVSLGRVVLTRDWRQYKMSLEGKNLSSVIGGFCWVASQPANPDGLTFYLDDIRFEK